MEEFLNRKIREGIHEVHEEFNTVFSRLVGCVGTRHGVSLQIVTKYEKVSIGALK